MSNFSVVDVASGGTQFNDFVEPIDGRTFTGAGALAQNTAYLLRFRVAEAIAITKIKLRCVSAAGAGNVDVNIYTSDGTTWTRLVAATTPVAVSAALQTITLAATANLAPRTDYWVALSCTEATSTFSRISVVAADEGGDGNMCLLKASQHPLGSSFSSLTAANIAPWLRLAT